MKIPKVESLIITIFFLCIGLWAISKCTSKRSELAQQLTDVLEPEPSATPQQTIPQTPAQEPAPQTYSQPSSTPQKGLPKLQNPAVDTPKATKAVPGVRPTLANPRPAAVSEYSTLYVTIKGLKLRSAPNLKSKVITRLKLDERVYFMNQKSEKPEEINLGFEKATDYWVKIRTQSGKEGWVFGAGVHYYKMKRTGVLEK